MMLLRSRFRRSVAALWFLALLSIPLKASATFLQIGQSFTGSVEGIDSGSEPADANGAVGPKHFVEFINGRFAVYEKATGIRIQSMADTQFWASSGVVISNGVTVTDPRILFDVYGQRWFSSMVDASAVTQRQTRNRFLLAVSASDDPTQAWHGFAFTADPINGDFADFPTLGVDQNAVYLAGDMFTRAGFAIGSGLVSIPKSGLLASEPTIDARTSFPIQAFNARGHILQPAVTIGSVSTGESVLAVGSLGLNAQTSGIVFFSTLQSTNPAVLSNATVLAVPSYTAPVQVEQPDGSSNLDPGDNRFSACVRRVGDSLYAVHTVQTNNHAAIRWYWFNAAEQKLLQTGLISDPNLDLFYPSIAANEEGTVVIGCNGSGIAQFLSCYAIVGETTNGVLTFGNRTLLKLGQASYQVRDSSGASRWGDYSATTVDPTDPHRFWTIQLYAASRTAWATQITELITAIDLTVTQDNGKILLSWPASSPGFQLQFATNLPPAAAWIPANEVPTVVGNRTVVSLPTDSAQGFYRLTR